MGRLKKNEPKFETTKRRKRRDVAMVGIEALSSERRPVEFGYNKLWKGFI